VGRPRKPSPRISVGVVVRRTIAIAIEASRQATNTTIPIFHRVGIGGKTRLVRGMREPEKVADGVWLLRGDFRGAMNIYFLEDGEGVVQFEAGTKSMRKAARAAGERLGGVKRVVLAHAHADHRGTAPYMEAPVYCHADEVADAESDAALSPYMDLSKLPVAPVRWIYPFLFWRWNSGPVRIAGTVSEGDEVAGFRVIHFPGHAPGLIGLWRESDRVALVSDVVYFVDSARLKPLPEGEASVPHPAFNADHEQAKESLRKLAALEPKVVCAGHAEPLRGENLRETLERAAEKL
jgi:glyoxylase-like metal-dependent hydrolase (beta-lactamase superfamily II)